MPSTPASAVLRRQVYVDVPVSTYPISRKSAPALALKENTPLRHSNRPALKRRFSERETIGASNAVVSSPKKQKLSDASEDAQTTSEFPHGFIYCHQCNQKRDALSAILCTSVSYTKRKGAEKRCNAKYCGPCLKRRYGEDAIELKAKGHNDTYTFKKAKGPELLGKIPPSIHASFAKAEVSKVASKITTTKVPKMRVEVVITTPSPSSSSPRPAGLVKKSAVASSSSSTIKPAAHVPTPKKLKQQQLPQPLRTLKWSPVPTALDREGAEIRFQIREFVLRFAGIMEPAIPKAQLAELDDVGCGDEDEDEMVPWVSEACARSMILGLLGMLAQGSSKNKVRVTSTIGNVIRDIRATGNSLNKIWPILASLRLAADNDAEHGLAFPEPLPLPASYTVRVTRSTRGASGSGPVITIANSAQMIPVIAALVEAASETPTVREELEDGLKEAKEAARKVKECLKAENERWDAERKELEAAALKEKETKGKGPSEVKRKREVYKRRVQSLESILKVVSPGFAPRFSSLGTDKGGRVYWALSPGTKERNAALDFIAQATFGFKDTRTARQRGRAPAAVGNAVDRSGTSEWSYFVAVWGKKIPAAASKTSLGKGKGKADTAQGDVVEEDEDVEQWWGFYEPADIRKIADWIRIDAGIDPYEGEDVSKPLAALIRGLNEYGALLEWRLKDDKYESLDPKDA
ncbi:hypothetical protein DXG03_001422 [Asterophora parasitica]|uniref:Zinc-finger domain-containing protein n=1 Tax=Asterophora parasitica TaxID=117018 RepID=A0A9P7GHC2_9AGAR|nr:hypothetical protein DXG03_001422 [Asterophora parasitica]